MRVMYLKKEPPYVVYAIHHFQNSGFVNCTSADVIELGTLIVKARDGRIPAKQQWKADVGSSNVRGDSRRL